MTATSKKLGNVNLGSASKAASIDRKIRAAIAAGITPVFTIEHQELGSTHKYSEVSVTWWRDVDYGAYGVRREGLQAFTRDSQAAAERDLAKLNEYIAQVAAQAA